MCFYIDSKYPNKKKAKRNITCYKILSKSWISIIQCFIYVQGKIYSDYNALNIEKGQFNTKIINKGYHSYRDRNVLLLTYNKIRKTYNYNLIIVKCIIPKGSDYYYNSRSHEYVSNKIKIIDIIK